MTSTLAPLQKPISSNRRRTCGSPPTAKTLPLQPMPSWLRVQVSGEEHPLHAANPHAFCITGSVSRGCQSSPAKRALESATERLSPAVVYVVETEFQQSRIRYRR